jgi:hypothetical protein
MKGFASALRVAEMTGLEKRLLNTQIRILAEKRENSQPGLQIELVLGKQVV